MKTYIFKENGNEFDRHVIESKKDEIIAVESCKKLIFKHRGVEYNVTKIPYEMYSDFHNYPYCYRRLIFDRCAYFKENSMYTDLKTEIESNIRKGYLEVWNSN